LGRTLGELLGTYLDGDDAREGRTRRAPLHDVRAVLAATLHLAEAVAPGSVVGLAYAAEPGRTVVRLGGVLDIERSLALSGRLADESSGGLAEASAEHLVVRAGDRVRLGADRGGRLDGGQRALLESVAFLAARSLARTGTVPLGPASVVGAPAGTASTTAPAPPVPAVGMDAELEGGGGGGGVVGGAVA
jgi:hypothetical protein